MARDRLSALLVVLIALALTGVEEHASVAPPARAAEPVPRAVSPTVDLAGVRAVAARERSARARAVALKIARRDEARRLRRSRTVPGALRRAWLAHAIGRRDYAAMRHEWWRAGRDAARLTGARRAELDAVLGVARALAQRRKLTASRLKSVFLTIRRNREVWTQRPLPASRARMTFRGDPVVFEYYAGRGLQIQPLASFGKANALAGACLRIATRYTCRPAALRRLLNRMVALGARRGGFLAWEYLFSFGSGAPPWISAMTQATGAQALARGTRALGDPRYARAARSALGAFEAPPPTGIAVAGARGPRYAMYSFAPDLQILNGELQALIGLRDVARISGSARARRLYARGERAARGVVRAFDTGAWSLYSAGGEESTLSYHRLLAGFLHGLCRRTARAAYCAAGRRFHRYVGEPPRVHVRTLRNLRAGRRTTIRFTLSKVSDVMLQVRDRRGRVELSRGLRGLRGGRHDVAWVPRLAGRHGLRIVALGPAGTRAVVRVTVRARTVHRTPRRAAARRAAASARR